MQESIIATSNKAGSTNKYQDQAAAFNKVREAMQGNVSVLENYRLRQGQVLTAQDAWQKKIREGKATLPDVVKNHKMFNEVLKEQLAIQKAVGLGWSQSSRTGKISTDMFIDKDLPATMNTLKNRIGLMSHMLNSASENMVNWGKNTQWAGRQLMVGFTVPLTIAAAALGKFGYDLDKQITQVVKVYGDATSAINSNTDDIRNAATETAKAAARIYGQSAEDTLGIMAQLAASGKAGMELQQATMATTRAAVLGELEWQDAVKATISMQEVYGAKQEQLADNWNYINAMENQTVLSAQDFVTAIPKVSGVMKSLGGDLKDTGTLLTAFRAAGIDAAEGANALKSINFRLVATYGKGLETFQNKTGKDLKSLINETNGETIPSLLKFADAIKNLSAADKVAVTRDVFGIYQGSKALMLIQQMTDKTEQWQTALDVAQNTNIENAAIAQQELDRQSERPFRQLDMAIQSIKIELATMGEAFLGPAANIINFVTTMIKGFNELNPFIKQFAAAIAIGLGIAGPIVMLIGLFGNLLGTALKFGSRLGILATKFKFLSEEERLQQIISKQMTNIWDAEGAAAARLANEMKILNAAFAEAANIRNRQFIGPMTKAQADIEQAKMDKVDQKRAHDIYRQNPVAPLVLPYGEHNKTKDGGYTGSKGQYVYPKVAHDQNQQAIADHRALVIQRRADALAQAQQERAGRELTAEKLAEKKATDELSAAQARAEQRTHRLTQAISSAALAAGMITSAVGPQEGIGNVLVQTINGFATLGIVAPGALAKVGTGIARVAAPLANLGKRAFDSIKGTAMSMIGYLKAAGPILAAIGIAAIILIQKWNDEIDKSRQKTEDAINFAKNTADTMGYSYTNAAGLDPNTIKDGQKATEVIAEKIKKNNASAAAAFSEMQGKSLGEKWGAAIAAGIDAKLHGATVDQAKSTTRAALQLMGKSFSDAEFEAEVGIRINFDDTKQMLEEQAGQWKTQLEGAMADNPINGWEDFFNGGQLSQDAGVIVGKIGQDFWDTFMQVDKGQRRKMITDFANEYDKFINDAYKAAQEKNPDGLKRLNINNAHDFSKGLAQNTLSATSLGMSEGDFEALQRRNNGLNELAKKIAQAGNVSESAREQIFTLWDLLQQPIFTDAMGEVGKASEKALGPTDLYDQKINEVLQSGKALTAEKIAQIQTDLRVADGSYLLGDAVQYFGDVSRGAAVDAEHFNEKLKELGFNATVTWESLNSSWKNIYSGAQDAMFAEASRQFEDAQQAQMDALQKKGQNALDAIEKKGDRLDAKQEKQTRALDDRLDKDKKAFDDAWDARKKREAAVYDARIKKIEDAIKAEQEAEALRQKIFEAEQTRIQRLAQMYSTNIDINAAINTGNMDEAAKLAANADAQLADWALSDASGDSKSASEKRIDDLNKQKDNIEKAKDAHMEALGKIEDAEKEAFKKRQERQKQQLKDSQDAAKKEIDNEKKKIQQQNADREKQLRDDQARTKRRLDSELATLRAFLPKDKQQLLTQATELEKVYDGFGVELTAKGNQWGGVVGKSLGDNVAKEGKALKSALNWSDVGKDIAAAMIEGAFDMDPKTFAAWLNGGKAPDNSLYGKKVAPVQHKYRKQTRDIESRHSGGVIGSGGGARTGYSGKYQQSEILVNALRGEGMVTRGGMRLIGKAGLEYINSGGTKGIAPGIGGGGKMGLGSGFGASVIGGTGKMIIMAALQAAYNKRAGIPPEPDKPSFGANIGVKEIGSTGTGAGPNVVYSSGKVVYLGHGAYPGGGFFGNNVRPAAGSITSRFGPRNLLGMSFHNGIDIAGAANSPIRAAQGGRVIFTGWDNTGYGNYTEIQSDDGTMYGYGHQNDILVKAGQRVATAQKIGLMGSTGKSTGDHLHFQIGRNGMWFNPETVMPQLNTGGLMMSDGIAKLHKEEAVLTKPLTRDLKEGVKNLADGGNVEYHVTLDFNGASFDRGIDFQTEVETALRNIDRKNGGTRRIGGNR